MRLTSHDDDNKNNAKKNNVNSRTDWKEVTKYVKFSLVWFEQLGIVPTLRTIFYRLVSLEIIPNTEQSYKSLSSTMVKARKSGEIPWNCFSDQGRQVLNGMKQYTSPEDYIDIGVNYLKNASNKYSIPRWHNQKNYVEVWIEKQALADSRR